MIWGIQNRIRVRQDHCGAVQLWNLPEASYNIPCCIMGNAGTGQVRPTLANLHYTQTPKMWPFISLKQPSTSCLQFIAEVGGLNITPQLAGIDINQNCEVMFLHMWLYSAGLWLYYASLKGTEWNNKGTRAVNGPIAWREKKEEKHLETKGKEGNSCAETRFSIAGPKKMRVLLSVLCGGTGNKFQRWET